jgi:hypothetical protein
MVDPMPHFPGMIGRRQRILGLGFGVLILIFGIIIGAGGTFLRFKDKILIQQTGPVGPNPQHIIQDMRAKLSLSEEQVKKIEELFHQQGQAWQEFSKKTSEFQKARWEEVIAGMKAILTPEQSSAWQKEMDERRQRWEREQRDRGFRGQGGPGQGGPGRGGPEGQRGPGGPDRGDRRGRPGQDDRPQQGPPPGGEPKPGEPMPGGPMPGGPGPGGPGPGPGQPGQPMPGGPGQPVTPPPGASTPDAAPKPAEPAPANVGSSPTVAPEQAKPQ